MRYKGKEGRKRMRCMRKRKKRWKGEIKKKGEKERRKENRKKKR
jgi:hypothetical protein